MTSIRREALNLLYNVLDKSAMQIHGQLSQAMRHSADGLVSLRLVYNLSAPLQDYPLEYIEYCISRDDDQRRFRWDVESGRVGLRKLAQYYETDPYGFAIQEQEEEEEDISHDRALPVIYDDGKFYIDEEYKRPQLSDGRRKAVFEYDRLEIPPLGLSKSTINNSECFNCGKRGHNVQDCPRPKDPARIRRQFRCINKRFYQEVELLSFQPGVLSQRLREALGISDREEPPYYAAMRYCGYPPGYYGTRANETEPYVPPLKVFDRNVVIHTSNDVPHSPPPPETNYSVHYEGLFPSYDSKAYAENGTYNCQNLTIEQQQWTDYYNNYYYYYGYPPEIPYTQ